MMGVLLIEDLCPAPKDSASDGVDKEKLREAAAPADPAFTPIIALIEARAICVFNL